MDLGLVSKIDFKPNSCEICVQSKFSRKPFKSAVRCFDLLGRIHSDICDQLNNIITRGGKKYFITLSMIFSDFLMSIYLKVNLRLLKTSSFSEQKLKTN